MCRGKTITACFESHLRISINASSSHKPAIIGCAWDRESGLCVNKVPAQPHPNEDRFFHTYQEMNEMTTRERLRKRNIRDFMFITSGVVFSYVVGVLLSGKMVSLYLRS